MTQDNSTTPPDRLDTHLTTTDAETRRIAQKWEASPCDCADKYKNLSRPQIEGIIHVMAHRMDLYEKGEEYHWRLEWTNLATQILDEWFDTRDELASIRAKIDRLESHAAQCAHWQANQERAMRQSQAPPSVNSESRGEWRA